MTTIVHAAGTSALRAVADPAAAGVALAVDGGDPVVAKADPSADLAADLAAPVAEALGVAVGAVPAVVVGVALAAGAAARMAAGAGAVAREAASADSILSRCSPGRIAMATGRSHSMN